MKSNTKKFLALLLAVAMVVTPVTSLRAEEPNVQGQENAENEQQEEVVEGKEAGQGIPSDIPQNVETPKVEENTGNGQISGNETVQQPENDTTVQQPTESQTSNSQGSVEDDSEEFKIVKSEAKENGEKVSVSFFTAKLTYNKIYIGNKEDAVKEPVIEGQKNDLGGYTFTFDVGKEQLGQKILIVPYHGEKNEWYVEKDVRLEIPEEVKGENTDSDTKEGTFESAKMTRQIPMLLEAESSEETGKTAELINGAEYSTTVESSSSMFNIVSCKMTSENGKVWADITLSGTSYTKLFIGTKEEAVGAEESQYIGYTENAEGRYVFRIPVSKLDEPLKVAAYSKKSCDWFDRELTFSSENLKIEKIPDGIYENVAVESSSTMFNVVDCTLFNENGTMQAAITLSGTGYTKLYVGTAEEAEQVTDYIGYAVDADGKYVFTIPVSELNTEIKIAAFSEKSQKWFDRILVFNPEVNNLKTLPDGTYDDIIVTSSNKMFKVIACTLSSENGSMQAAITLSGTGYTKLYMGSTEEAQTAENHIDYTEDTDGRYVFTIPVSGLNTDIEIAALGSKWYDRTLVFSWGTSCIPCGVQEESTDNPENPGGSTGNTGDTGNSGSSGSTGSSGSQNNCNPDSESKYESDLSGSTGKVNNTTKLKDGVYTPDSFTWSGGTGRVSISCTKITITNGQAYATIVFSSPNYGYVKANGNKYYATVVGGTSVFTIPVELNKNNQIIGMTTAMSTAHEVAYNIFIYLAAAGEADGKTVLGSGMGSSKKLDEEAPDILGLEYEDEVTLDYAEYFKLYKYEQGITLLEIDLVSGTVREDAEDEETEKDSKKKVESEDETENVEDDDSAETSEETASNVQTQEEIVAELYKENVVKYLIVPEGVEIPAGLDKEVVVIQQPVDKTYAASDDILEQLEQMDMLDQVAAVACEEDDCKIDAIADKMEKEEISFAGTYEEPDFKKLISSKCNLSLLPADILPQEDEKEDLTVEEQEERFFEQAEKYALLDIPVVIDRSADEEEELAQKEWVKIYGAIFGCEEKAEELFHAAVAAKK